MAVKKHVKPDTAERSIVELVAADLTVDETAKILKVDRTAIFRYIRNGVLDSYKFGHCRRIKVESIEALRNGGA